MSPGRSVSMKVRPVIAALMFVLCFPLFAQDAKPAGGDKPSEKPPEPKTFVKQHRMKIGAEEVAYTTTSEELFLTDGAGKNTASFFTIAYPQDGAKEDIRTVTVLF